MKSLLFSVSLKDLTIQTFRGSGKGGQKRNKTSNCVRLIHPPSNATGQGRDGRSLEQNKRTALTQLANTKEFKNWVRIEAARLAHQPSIEQQVESLMQPHNLKIETMRGGVWEKATNPDTL